MRRMALGVVAALLLAAPAPAFASSGGSSPLTYRPPVDAPVTDPFRPPPEPWAPGNRGIEYATSPGTHVRAAGDGEVVFAGPVAGGLHVVVLHPDGIRTSYSFLQSIAVHRGDRVAQGQPVGTAAERLHFGARLGDVYLDPAHLFADGPPDVFLVPDEVRRPTTESGERSGLLGMLEGLGRDFLGAGARGVAWARDTTAAGARAGADALEDVSALRLRQLRTAVHYLRELHPYSRAARAAGTTWAWWQQRRNCTPASVAAPRLGERHLAVLVGGLASSSTSSNIDDVDTAGLGYAPADVMRFSYLGGTTTQQPYAPSDTTIDIRLAARRLYQLLERVARENPGAPIDILAHSQGGVVARTALAYELDSASPSRPPIGALVTLASPHQGADLATAATMMGGTNAGYLAQTGAHLAQPGGADLRGTSVHQLSETSLFMDRLNDRPLPAGVRVTSIGGRGDLIVPAGRTQLAGAHNVVLAPPGWIDQHSRLPGSQAAQREIALGLAGRPPTCQDLADMLVDTAVTDSISRAEDTVGVVGWLGGAPTGPAPVPPDDPGGSP